MSLRGETAVKVVEYWTKICVSALNHLIPKEILELVAKFITNPHYFVSTNENHDNLPIHQNISWLKDNTQVIFDNTRNTAYGSICWTKSELKKPFCSSYFHPIF